MATGIAETPPPLARRWNRHLYLGLGLGLAGTFAVPAAAQSPDTTLTLADALARARTSSPAVEAVRARVDAARGALARAGRPLNPLVEIRSENWASRAPGGLPLDIFATVTQTVELGGKRGARRGVADAAVEASAALEAVVWREVAFAVTTEYVAALRAREHLRALDAHGARLTEAVRVMERRVDVGAAPEADLLKLRTEAARLVVDRTRADVTARRAVATLGARLGVDVGLEQLQQPAPPNAGATRGAELRSDHPDLVAATRAVETARAAAELERARALPDIGVNAGVKRTSGYNTGVAAFTVTLPVFDKNHVARALANGQVRAAEFERSAVERRLRGAIAASGQAASTLTAHAADTERTLVEPARQARDAAHAAFASGALDVLRLVDAERIAIDAERVAIDLEFDATLAAIEARLAAGEEPLP